MFVPFLRRSLRSAIKRRSPSRTVVSRSREYSVEGVEKIQPPGSPYSSHGSPLRTPMSSGHGTPQDSPHVARHRRDSEHSSGVGSRRGSSDVVSPLPEGPSGSPDARARRRSDYSPHQGRSWSRDRQHANHDEITYSLFFFFSLLRVFLNLLIEQRNVEGFGTIGTWIHVTIQFDHEPRPLEINVNLLHLNFSDSRSVCVNRNTTCGYFVARNRDL